ncbi:hypothetical protein BGX34_004623 [Mortierella sp. NVP85]|nr:hypothetical protein BGX34_004623 [Mortierella sp. NVP85]
MSQGDQNAAGPNTRTPPRTSKCAKSSTSTAVASSAPYVKKYELLFRKKEYPDGMCLDVRSANPQALVFFLPPNSPNPLDLVTAIAKTFGPITGVDISPTADAGNKVEIVPMDATVYKRIKTSGIEFNGQQLTATVPAPTKGDFHKIKFKHAPVAFKLVDFQRIFSMHGSIIEIKRYYWSIEGSKVYSGEGSILLDRSTQGLPRHYTPLPNSIDLGAGCRIVLRQVATVNNTTTAAVAAKPPSSRPPQPSQLTDGESVVIKSET